ncbi:MAG TPA: ABC transporter substrate-binding protein [Bacteriovoracaceae bacterium]|nr:ABC transporter substrate-binding protein [Bacteriovoracaceae bacterium]
MKYVFLAFLLVVGCTKQNVVKDTISISIPSEIISLDPANCYDTVCNVPVTQVYESLFELEYLKRPYTLRPLIAKSFPVVSEDRRIYTFKIKKGITYHPSDIIPKGREVKAQDFVDQIKRIAFEPTRSTGWWLYDGKIKGLNEWRKVVGNDLEKFFNAPVEGLSAPDDETLVIELIQPYPQLLYTLAMSFSAPIPAEAIRSTKNDLSLKHAGTGPYFIHSFNLSQEVILKKYPGYLTSVYPAQGDRYANEQGLLKDAGAKLPFVENVRLVVIKESQTDWLNFLKHKIDMINLTKDHYHVALTADGKLKPEIGKDNIKLQASPTLIYWWLQFNMKDPVLGNNLNLRKAIAHGINIEKYIELFTYNVAQKANSIYPPGIPGYSPSSDLPYKYDLGLAREFLAKAGYPEGKGLPKLVFDIRGTDTRRRQMGEYIQKELRTLGMSVDVNVNTFPAFLEKSRKGQLQFWQGGWVLDYPDAENVLQLLNSANMPAPNYSQYSNKKFDLLFNQLKFLEDGEEKFGLMRQMEKIVNEDMPWAMQYYTRNYILHHAYLENFRYSDIIYNNIKYLKLNKKE